MIVDVNPRDELAIPTQAYVSTENVAEVCSSPSSCFALFFIDFHSVNRRSQRIVAFSFTSHQKLARLKPKKLVLSTCSVMSGFASVVFSLSFCTSSRTGGLILHHNQSSIFVEGTSILFFFVCMVSLCFLIFCCSILCGPGYHDHHSDEACF